MIGVRFRISIVTLTLGGIVVAIGAAVLTLPPRPQPPALSLAGTLVFGLGVLLCICGCLHVVKRVKVQPMWDEDLLWQALRSAPPRSTVRILETWHPKPVQFCPFLEELLTRGGKRFTLEVLLLDPGKPGRHINDLLAARVLVRPEDRDHAYKEIDATIRGFRDMKEHVDEEWGEKRNGASLNLSIRCYRFLPFGPIWQVGNSYLFVGFFVNHASSLNAPMLVLRDPKSEIWRVFERSFTRGWESAQVCPE